ncbi:MAG: hypothetical protein NT049_16540, partial [Planctomycetota bacterium]|nr:hypothetical protein [Planctomycetota bacterium]
AETVAAIQREMGVLRGTLDAFDVEVAKAARPLDEALAKNLITIDEYQGRLQELKAAMAGLKEVKAADALKKEGQALSESLRTPEERAKAEIDKARRQLDSGAIGSDTYERAVRKALEDAASAMPEVARQTIGVRGTFSVMEATGLGAGGIADAMLEAQRQTAKNTERIAQLAANLGVTFN